MSAEKKTIEELILSKPITPEIVNRLFYVYNSDWNRYVSMIKRILDQSILSGVQDIKVLVDKIDSVPSCENENYEEKLFTDEKKKIFCMWLFKSHILCLNADERVVGRKIEHDLPITFKVYFSKNMAGNINASDSLEFKIKQATKLQELIMKQLKPILEEFDFYIKPVGAFTSESEFDSFQISLGFNSYYSKSEDIYIKTFVKDIIKDEKKLKEAKESLNQSTEGVGTFLKATGTLLLIYTAYEVIKGIIGIKKEEKEKEKYMNSDEFKKFAKEIHELALKAMDYQSYLIKNINNKMKKKYNINFDFSSKWLYKQADEKTVIKDYITPYLMKYRNGDNNIIACTMDICTSEDIDSPDINQKDYDNDIGDVLNEMYDYFVESLNELAYEWLKKNAKGKIFYDTSNKPIDTKSVIYTSTLYYEIFPLTLTLAVK